MQSFANHQTSGLASSVVFTPIKGMELENPERSKKKVEDANDKYFGANSKNESI